MCDAGWATWRVVVNGGDSHGLDPESYVPAPCVHEQRFYDGATWERAGEAAAS